MRVWLLEGLPVHVMMLVVDVNHLRIWCRPASSLKDDEEATKLRLVGVQVETKVVATRSRASIQVHLPARKWHLTTSWECWFLCSHCTFDNKPILLAAGCWEKHDDAACYGSGWASVDDKSCAFSCVSTKSTTHSHSEMILLAWLHFSPLSASKTTRHQLTSLDELPYLS